jgi:hypothetical protein
VQYTTVEQLRSGAGKRHPPYRIEQSTVGKHKADIGRELGVRGVLTMLQFVVNRAQVHRIRHDGEVLRDALPAATTVHAHALGYHETLPKRRQHRKCGTREQEAPTR